MSDDVIWVESPFDDTVTYGVRNDEPPEYEPWTLCPKCNQPVDAKREEGDVAHCEGCGLDFVICAQWEMIPCCKEECACPCHERAGYAGRHQPDCAEALHPMSRSHLPQLTIPEIVYWLSVVGMNGIDTAVPIRTVIRRELKPLAIRESTRWAQARLCKRRLADSAGKHRTRQYLSQLQRDIQGHTVVAYLLRQARHAIAREPKLLGSQAT
jgi:hypothetical protein